MTPEQALRELERKANALPDRLREAVKDTTTHALGRAQWWSSGTLTPAQLRRLDHPYARRHGRPLLEPDRVSQQSGTFLREWAAEPVTETEDTLSASVVNHSRVAERFLHPGTAVMFARRPNEAAAEETEPEFNARVARAIEDTLR